MACACIVHAYIHTHAYMLIHINSHTFVYINIHPSVNTHTYLYVNMLSFHAGNAAFRVESAPGMRTHHIYIVTHTCTHAHAYKFTYSRLHEYTFIGVHTAHSCM